MGSPCPITLLLGSWGLPSEAFTPPTVLLTKLGMSAIAGHSHLYDEKIATRADGKKMMALVAGCYVHPDMVEGWNRDTAHMWWNGCVMMTGVKDGWAETVTRMSQDWVKRNYA